MEEAELKYWLALHHAPGVGAVRFAEILSKVPDLPSLFNASSEMLDSWKIPARLAAYIKNPDWSVINKDLHWAADNSSNHILTIADADYPELLKDIHDPPPLLYLRGNMDLLSLPQLAIVGSRNPTKSGELLAKEFAAFLAQHGFVITSGLAIGVDGAAHEGALKVQGKTIAVVATGLDRVYPASHYELAHQIAQQGLLVSEFPPGTSPRPGNFPRRNRIISGLSVGTLVVEAMLKSGSLITARLTAEQGREVFAIPGSIHNPLARGCHQLIKQGAKLVETAQDIVEELAPMISTLIETPEKIQPVSSSSTLDQDYQQLLTHMGYDPISIDQLVELSGLTPEEVSSMLLMLELDGYISSQTGGFYCRNGSAQQVNE